MNDEWKTDIIILHKIIDSHDAAIRAMAANHDAMIDIMAERIDALQRSMFQMGTVADTNFDELYAAVRIIANETFPHLVQPVEAKPKLRLITKDDDA
jgi:hypothetical protein